MPAGRRPAGLLSDGMSCCPCRLQLRGLLHALCPGMRACTRTEPHPSKRKTTPHLWRPHHTCGEATEKPGTLSVAQCHPTVAHRAMSAMSTPQFSGPSSSLPLGGPTYTANTHPSPRWPRSLTSRRHSSSPAQCRSPRCLSPTAPTDIHTQSGPRLLPQTSPPPPLTSRRPSCLPPTCCSAPPGSTQSACGTRGSPRSPRRGTRGRGAGASPVPPHAPPRDAPRTRRVVVRRVGLRGRGRGGDGEGKHHCHVADAAGEEGRRAAGGGRRDGHGDACACWSPPATVRAALA